MRNNNGEEDDDDDGVVVVEATGNLDEIVVLKALDAGVGIAMKKKKKVVAMAEQALFPLGSCREVNHQKSSVQQQQQQMGGGKNSALIKKLAMADETRRRVVAGATAAAPVTEFSSDRRRRVLWKEEENVQDSSFLGTEDLEKGRVMMEEEAAARREQAGRHSNNNIIILPEHCNDLTLTVNAEEEEDRSSVGNQKLEGKGKTDDCSSLLRDRVWVLEEENGKLHKERAAMTLKETVLRYKVSEFESQMEGHRKRVDRAEKIIMELRHEVVRSNTQARQAEWELEELRKACTAKERENQDLQNLVGRLQKLCVDHEKSIHGLRQGLKDGMDGNKEGRMTRLQRELHRLSGAEMSLRTELEASRSENATLRRDMNGLLDRLSSEESHSTAYVKKVEQDLRAEIDRGHAQVAEMQDENNLLLAKLKLVMRERQDTREASRVSKARFAGIEEEKRSLQEEVAKGRDVLQARERDLQELEEQLELLTKKNQMYQAACTLRDKAAAATNGFTTVKEKEKETQEAQQIESEMWQSLQAAAQQLSSMNERLEALMDKLSERDAQLQEARAESARKDEMIHGLEQSLSNLARTVDSQSARLMRHTKQNEDLINVMQLQVKQIEDLQVQIAAAVDRKNKAEKHLEQLNEQMEGWQQEIQSQDLNCHLLREKVETLEAKLQKCHTQITLLLQNRDELCSEKEFLQQSLSDTTHRIAKLEQQLTEKEEAIKVLEASLEKNLEQVAKVNEEICRVTKERNEMQQEAEAMSREALRTSVEVEMLQRRVQQLDEDLLIRDGQIAILRCSMEEN